MNTVGPAYRFQLVPEPSAGTGGVKSTNTGGGKSGSEGFQADTLRQRGFQSSAGSAGEFKPYNGGTARMEDTSVSGKSVIDGTTGQDSGGEAQIAQLKAVEEKVKAHEAAHKSAGGTATGAVSYSYTRGPDGRNYITGGEVAISVSPGKTPQETIDRMELVIRAALAPADPSSQDRAVAARAAAEQQEARSELASSALPSTTVSYYA